MGAGGSNSVSSESLADAASGVGTGIGGTPGLSQWLNTTDMGKAQNQNQQVALPGAYGSGNESIVQVLQGEDPSLMAQFQAWQADQNNANQTWSNYAKLVARQGGPEGAQTVTGAYQSILAAQTSAGTVGNPASYQSVMNQTRKTVGAP